MISDSRGYLHRVSDFEVILFPLLRPSAAYPRRRNIDVNLSSGNLHALLQQEHIAAKYTLKVSNSGTHQIHGLQVNKIAVLLRISFS